MTTTAAWAWSQTVIYRDDRMPDTILVTNFLTPVVPDAN